MKIEVRRIRNLLASSLRRQLILGVAAVHAVMMTIFVFDLVERQKDFLHERQVEQTRVKAENLAVSASAWVLARDFAGMAELVEASKKDSSLLYAMLVGKHGLVLAHSDPSLVGKQLVDSASKRMLEAREFHWLANTESVTDAAMPIVVNGDVVGWARVALSQRQSMLGLHAVMRNGLIYTVLAILIGAVLAMLMARRMTRRLNRLRETMDRVREGEVVDRVHIGGIDEAAALARDFNAMLAALDDRREQLKNANEALSSEKELALVTLSSIGDGVATTDANGRVTFLNPVAELLTGWRSEDAKGHAISEVMCLVNEDSRAPVENPADECRRERRVVAMANHTVLVSRDGQERAIEDSAAPIFNGERELVGVVMVFHDVSEKRSLTRQMAWQVAHDHLTGLVNRKEFDQRLVELLDRAQIDQSQHALLYLDLDQFKVVNDTCGHQAGDEMLRQLAGVLQSAVRQSDLLARLGGDEFGVLLEDCPADKAEAIAEKLRNIVREFRFVWGGRHFEVGVSIGLVVIDADSGTAADVLADADMACYAAKDRGRNRVHRHSASDEDVRFRRDQLLAVSTIRSALDENRIALFAQEIRPLQGGSSHYELLMRVSDEQGRLQPPATVIPAAERYGMMGEIDRWVVRRAFDMLMESGQKMDVSINLSGLSVADDRFVDFVRQELARTKLDAKRICFEITETAAITHLAQAIHFITEMKSLGFMFALDDFGSGMSSFAYLKNLPVDYLKIDGVFVRDIAVDPIDRAFVETINRIGQVMGKSTIAEFAEDDAVLRELAYIGVDYAQGYGVAKPMPFDEVLGMMR